MTITIPMSSKRFMTILSIVSFHASICIFIAVPFPFKLIGAPFLVVGIIMAVIRIVIALDDGELKFKS